METAPISFRSTTYPEHLHVREMPMVITPQSTLLCKNESGRLETQDLVVSMNPILVSPVLMQICTAYRHRQSVETEKHGRSEEERLPATWESATMSSQTSLRLTTRDKSNIICTPWQLSNDILQDQTPSTGSERHIEDVV